MPPDRRAGMRTRIGVVSAVLWTALILGLYYWVHKPLTPSLARALGGALRDLATAAGVVTLAGGLGRRLLRRLDLAEWSSAERVAAPALIGLGALSLLVLAVGSLALTRLSMIALAVCVAALTLPDLVGWLRDLREWTRGGLPRPGWLALAVIVLAALALLMALLPPVKWDVLAYHLVGPDLYVQHGRFYAAPHNHFLGFPQLVETLYAGQLAITGHLTTAGPLHWMIGALALLMTGGYTARHAGRAAGWMATAALLTALTIWLEMTFAYVDLMLLGLAAVGLAVAERWEQSGKIGWLALLGVIIGLAMGTKYTALWMAVAFGAWVLWRSRGGGWRALVQNGAIYGGAAALLMLPWLARNTIWYGSPVYPLVFESGEMDALRQDWYRQPGSGLVHTANAWQIPVMPLAATVFGVETAGTYGADIGPLFAMLVPLLALAWARLPEGERQTARRALAVSGTIMACWIGAAAFGSYIHAQTRLVLYMLPPLAVVCGIALEGLRRLPDKPLNLAFVLRAMVALVIVFTLVAGLRLFSISGIHVYFTASSDFAGKFLIDRLGWHYEAMRQVNALPPGTRVRFLWEPRSLYCDRDRVACRPDSLMDAWYHARRTVDDGSPAAIADRWRAEGDTILLVYEFGRTYERKHQDLYDPADWAAWDVFAAEFLVEVWRGGNAEDDIQYILYRWREETAS